MTKQATPTTGAELAAVARDAVAGIAPALRMFQRVMKAAGYAGRSGGWVYDFRGVSVARGWQGVAETLTLSQAERAVSRIRIAETEAHLAKMEAKYPTPEPATEPEHPRLAEQREQAALALRQPGTVSAGCPNRWHLTAPARLRQTCPECPASQPQPASKQLLALLDAGAEIVRLGGTWTATGHVANVGIDSGALDRTARELTDAGLAQWVVTSDGRILLRPAPIHTDRPGSAWNAADRRTTTDRSQVTCRHCKAWLAGEDNRLAQERAAARGVKPGATVTIHPGIRRFEVTEVAEDMARVWPLESTAAEGYVSGRWISLDRLHAVAPEPATT